MISFPLVSFLFSVFLGFSSCSDNEKEGDEQGPVENIELTIVPERTKLLKNPMMGWVIYSGLGNGLSDTFWEEYDNFNSSKGKVKVSDYATTLFIRGAWSDFNPEENKYVWHEDVNTKPAQRFKMLVKGAKERNLKLAFSFIVDSRDKHYNFTPAYVKSAPGIAGYTTTTGSVQVWSPYPDNAVFQRYYEKFIKDFAGEFDDPGLVQFISGTGLGKWGESHSLRYTTEDNAPREKVFDWVTDLYANSFKNVPVVINYHRCILLRNDWITESSPEIAESERLLNKVVEKGFSLRHDAFGMKTYYANWEKKYAAAWKYKRPIIMEGGWVKNSHGNSIKGDGYADYADVRKGEFNDAKVAFANMMDLRYNSNLANGETYSWFNDAFTLVEQFIAEGGYRLYPNKISLPEKMRSGSTITLTHRWSNLGWGYCPTNIPQWKGRYKVAFALLDKSTLKPEHIFVDEDPELSDWIQDSPKSYTFKPVMSDVAAGNYMWAVGLVDTTKNNNIGIQISAKDNITGDGWLKLCEVTVQ